MRPAPPRSGVGGGGAGAGIGSPAAASARTAVRSPGLPAASSPAIQRVIIGAATLVPFIATTEPLRVPAARTPACTAESSQTAARPAPAGRGEPFRRGA